MKLLLILINLSIVTYGMSANSAISSPQDSSELLMGSWLMDSTYFYNGGTKTGSAAYGKNVWVFKPESVLEVHMETLDPVIGEHKFENGLLIITLWGAKSIYHIQKLNEAKLAIKVDPSSAKVISESVFVRVE